MIYRFSKTVIILALFFLAPACHPSPNMSLLPTDSVPVAATVIQAGTPTPFPSSIPSPFPTSRTTEIAPVIPTEIIPISEVEFDNLDLYRQAMRPDFANDVDTVDAAGASHYHIEVSLDPATLNNENGPVLNGTEQVRYTNTENGLLSEIYFRLYANLPGYDGQLTVETVIIESQVVEPQLEAEASALRVPLPRPLAPGEAVDISLTYSTVIPRQSRSGYNILVYEDNTITLAGFYPVIASYDEQGWDVRRPPYYGDATYLDISLYQVQLTVPEELVVAASGSLVDRTLNNDGTKTLSLVSGPMRDFSIAMRTDYEIASETIDGVTVNSYFPSHLEDGGKAALRHSVDSLRVFNERFGPYPYAEFDVVATPTNAGGIEYPGLVAINQQLYDSEGAFFQQTISHEVAHQWWYGVVGNDQVNEPWLDESLTNFSTVFYWEAIEGMAKAKQIGEGYFWRPYERARAMGQDRSVVGPVADFSERDYGIFVYGKGPLFFNALRQQVGDDVFLEIMQTYYTNYRYKIAHAEDLLELIERVSGQDIDPLSDTWLQSSE